VTETTGAAVAGLVSARRDDRAQGVYAVDCRWRCIVLTMTTGGATNPTNIATRVTRNAETANQITTSMGFAVGSFLGCLELRRYPRTGLGAIPRMYAGAATGMG